ncbi:transcription cofactor HES-6-like [Xiphophorus maculatus]|uniref:Hes family bHLH transcription factor 6 n=1 Tax=Xiphophorus maculatus TaxID=8083 RepID=M3ZJW0_XIPMA|nr:transcription cofactor HES-6-like [Xiphophorus maculatus]XP_032402042.1 transcription cofactor HES-6-like [Xiphophorus hellerii]
MLISPYKYQQQPVSASNTTHRGGTINTGRLACFSPLLRLPVTGSVCQLPPFSRTSQTATGCSGRSHRRGVPTNMAPAARPGTAGLCMEEDESCYGIQKADRKIRKPLVEKKRRARINESLQELRTLLADTDLHSKMENAEVLEMTVKKVEDVLKNRSQEADALSREASERFAAGYIQCMHEVHMFVSNCPGIDATVAAELLNHLLECMPLNEDHLQDVLMDLITDTPGTNGSTWLGAAEGPCPTPALSNSSNDELCSDLDETDSEHNQSSTEGAESGEALSVPTVTNPQCMWRPW